MDVRLELHYLPSIQYMSKFLLYDHVVIDDMENFEKQSYRNRARLLGANGVLTLSVPVRNSRAGLPAKEIVTDNQKAWYREHWQSLLSAYGRSAFWEHYKDELEAIYADVGENLFDLNLKLLRTLLKRAKIEEGRLILLSEYEKGAPEADLRDAIHPKERYSRADPYFQSVPYFQVFADKFGFTPNLSFIDLLFNEGPAARQALDSCIIR